MRKLTLFLACLLLPACGSKPKDLLVGRWRGKSPGATVENVVEFTADGRVTKTPVGPGEAYGGTYRWTDGDHIETELTPPGGKAMKETNQVSVSKDSLTLTNPQGRVDKFTREP
jgi:hypothetical protein